MNTRTRRIVESVPFVRGAVSVEASAQGGVVVTGSSMTAREQSRLNGYRCRCGRKGCNAMSVGREMFVPSLDEVRKRFPFPTEADILSLAVSRHHRPARPTFPLLGALEWERRNRAEMEAQRTDDLFSGTRFEGIRRVMHQPADVAYAAK